MMNKIEIYTTEDRNIELRVRLDGDTVWLNRQQLSELLGRDIKTIGKHITNIFKEGELSASSTVAKYATVQMEGKRQVEREIEYYNLDVIISVGYRVKSQQGVQFRQWATQRLKDYLIKGFAINQKRIQKNKQQFLTTLEDLKILTNHNTQIDTKDILSLIESFSNTFFTLESYDKNNFPKKGEITEIKATAKDLKDDLQILKKQLISKGEASD